MTTAKKSHIAVHMVLQSIFAIIENLASGRNKDTMNNPPFRKKWMAALHDANLATEKYGALNNTISKVQLNLNLTYYATQCLPQISSKRK